MPAEPPLAVGARGVSSTGTHTVDPSTWSITSSTTSALAGADASLLSLDYTSPEAAANSASTSGYPCPALSGDAVGAPMAHSTTDIPPSLFYNFPSCRGPAPSARWAHSSCAVGTHLVTYGGIGHTLHEDLWALDTKTLIWRPLSPRAATAKDKPETSMGHAAAALGSTMWMFGGQQGRSLLRKLHVLDLEAMTWRRVGSNDTVPVARAGHAMVPVTSSSGSGGAIYLFGGQGKKLLNDLYRLDPATGLFSEIKAAGRLPIPRRGMSLVYDGQDSLVCFGGTHASGIDAALSVYSISRSEWTHPQQLGAIPSARTNHSAVLLAPHQVLLFGGCNAQGTFFNDAAILDTRTFTWHHPQLLNAAPAARYHHTCCIIGGRAYIYGGINAKQTFDGVVVLDTRFDNEISHIAEELRGMTAGLLTPRSDASIRSAASGGGGGGDAMDSALTGAAALGASRSVDVMKVQLMDLLYKRNMEELHAQASQKAELTEQQLAREREVADGLRREVMQLKILSAETEEASVQAAQVARVAQAQASKNAALVAELRLSLEAKDQQLGELRAEAEASRRLHQGLVKELGLVASRYSKLQQLHKQKVRTEGQQTAAAAASLDSVMMSSQNIVSDSQAPSQSWIDQEHLTSSSPLDLLASAQNSQLDPGLVSIRPAAQSGDQDTVCLQRLDRSNYQRLQSASTPTEGNLVLAHFDDILSLLGDVGQQKDDLEQQVAELKASLEQSTAKLQAQEVQLEQLQGEAHALRELGLEGLRALEEKLGSSLQATREAIIERRMAEVERVASEQQACSLCLERPRGIVFNCGHQSCSKCSEKLPACPFCRMTITTRIKLFNS